MAPDPFAPDPRLPRLRATLAIARATRLTWEIQVHRALPPATARRNDYASDPHYKAVLEGHMVLCEIATAGVDGYNASSLAKRLLEELVGLQFDVSAECYTRMHETMRGRARLILRSAQSLALVQAGPTAHTKIATPKLLSMIEAVDTLHRALWRALLDEEDDR